MRLLECQSDGSFHLTKDVPDTDIAQYPYAILSHRWGLSTEEVTFEDMGKGSGRDKAGYNKIEFCGQEAVKDGLKYFWVDSCCIDKTSQTELSEAINSMYWWYSRAARCYVYLSDVSTAMFDKTYVDPYADPQNIFMPEFRASVWFSRGWTLQELLAPRFVEFFSCERKRLGDRMSLRQEIHEITGIPLPALAGTELSQFSPKERFEWARTRTTTKEEDWAYCLIGILGVSLPLVYGERHKRARERLEREVNEASYGR